MQPFLPILRFLHSESSSEQCTEEFGTTLTSGYRRGLGNLARGSEAELWEAKDEVLDVLSSTLTSGSLLLSTPASSKSRSKPDCRILTSPQGSGGDLPKSKPLAR